MGRAHNGFDSFETHGEWSAPNLHSKAYEADRNGTYPSRDMDFCPPCQRHLNGALACPGCGTPVETLHAWRREDPAVPPGHEGGGAEPAGGAGTALAEEPVEEPAGASAEEPEGEYGEYGDEVPRGRRADRRQGRRRGAAAEDPSAGRSRRDRKAAAHRRRRNRALLIAAGFVLAAGALSLAELGLEIPGSKPDPAGSGQEAPDGGAAEVEPEESAGGAVEAPVREESPSPSASTSASPSASESPGGEESPQAEEEPEAEEGASSAPADGPPSADPTAAPPADPPSEPETPEPAPTTGEPEPEPEPSETCDRFLWWCT